jgi:hypothetical protein
MADVNGTTQASENLPDGSLKTQHNCLIYCVESCLVVLGIIPGVGLGC